VAQDVGPELNPSTSIKKKKRKEGKKEGRKEENINFAFCSDWPQTSILICLPPESLGLQTDMSTLFLGMLLSPALGSSPMCWMWMLQVTLCRFPGSLYATLFFLVLCRKNSSCLGFPALLVSAFPTQGIFQALLRFQSLPSLAGTHGHALVFTLGVFIWQELRSCFC
jgi:hypothetical protein